MSKIVLKVLVMADNILIYTDGGCSGNPGPGGWGYLILDASAPEESALLEKRLGGEIETTNNRMELMAVIAALSALEKRFTSSPKSLIVYTDSQYVQKGMTLWLTGWKRNGWRTASKSPVKNKDLWLELDALSERLKPEFRWVKGHSGDKYNEICDDLTQEAIANIKASSLL